MSTDTVEAVEPAQVDHVDAGLDEQLVEADVEQVDAAPAPAQAAPAPADDGEPSEVFPAGGVLTTVGNTLAIAGTAAWQGVGGLGVLLIGAVGALVSALLWGSWRRRSNKAKGAGSPKRSARSPPGKGPTPTANRKVPW